MKEATVVVTCEITFIGTLEYPELLKTKAEVAASIEHRLDADHVNVLNLQHFIRDLPSQSGTEVVETP